MRPLKKKINKIIFAGDTDSINLEIICNSHKFLKNKVNYYLVGNIEEISAHLEKLKKQIKINEIIDPFDFTNLKDDYLNIYNLKKSNSKIDNLVAQINFCNSICNKTKFDLVTMPIDKSVFKKKMKFNGMTELLAEFNSKHTVMLMYGEVFSVIPLTTHINPKNIFKDISPTKIEKLLKIIFKSIKNKNYDLKFKDFKFLCYNPHCGEKSTLGLEDNKIENLLKKKFKFISGPYPGDSAFKKIKKDTLFFSTYHDQALIPFKIFNKKGVNITLGLDYRRLSPAHGTAKDIKFKNLSDPTSYLRCMLI